jgi:hypothetical protein
MRVLKPIFCCAVVLVTAAASPAATVLANVGAFGFPAMLSYRNATSRGWNFGNSAANAPAVTLLGVPFAGNTGVSDAATGLVFTTAPSTYAISGFVWTGAPEQAARDALSRGGLHGGAGNFAMRFNTVPGKSYILEILALDAATTLGRSMDVIIDGVTVINDWVVPLGNPFNRLARIQVVADADGIDLRLGRGGAAGLDTNPAISAVTLTEETPSPPGFSVDPCSQTQPVGGRAVFSVVATGNPAPTVVWRRNGVVLEGQTGLTLTLNGLTEADAGEYDVVAVNESGSAESGKAVLRLVPLVQPSVFTEGLRGYWRFDEKDGCTVADASGQHRSGNLVNYPVSGGSHWATGRVGGALRFGGASTLQHVIVPAVPLPTAKAYSLAAWVQADARPVWASIAKNWFGFMHFGLDAAGGQLSNYLGLSPSGQIRVAETAVFPLNEWQHVVCTVDATALRLYRNGVLTATQAYAGTWFAPLPAPMGIGVKLNGAVADTGTPGYWQGLIDEMALWHRTLSAEEVATLYAAGVQGLSLDNPNPRPPVEALVISEYLADNSGGALDEDYDSSDWVEICNGTSESVNLEGYGLTDDLAVPGKWRFPAVTLGAGRYLLVWASGKDRRVAGRPLHANFQLGDEESLVLTGPDGKVVHGYGSPLTPPGGDWYPVETNVSIGIADDAGKTGYFVSPTPGIGNASMMAAGGPLIDRVTGPVGQPAAGTAVVVTARVRAEQSGAVSDAVGAVSLIYRVMYGAEVSVGMRDDGGGGDVVGGDGVYTGVIPAGHGAVAGRMLRWRVTAGAASGALRRAPQHLRDDAPEYYGTVVADPAVTTRLPVVHRFMQSPALADTEAGTVGSLYFNGEFHDNCYFRLRGNTSRSFPKKSHKVDLPPGRRVPLRPVMAGEVEAPQVSELNLNTTYTDKSYMRALMAAEMHGMSGIASPEIFHVHQRENGVFYSVALCVENVDDRFLERHGIDEHGAFYKAVGDNGLCDFTTAEAYEKKNRQPEGYGDLQGLVTSLGLTGAALEAWLFDNADLPSWVNWHAGTVISQNIDASNKNYYIHRDTMGSREWSVLPWDLDLSFGPNALNTDVMVFNQSAPSTPQCTSHPLIGARPWQLHAGKFNRMIEALSRTPRVREMIARRIRTLSDRFLATGWFGSRMDALVPLIDADVTADHAKWGANSHFAWTGGTAYTLAQSVGRIKTSYLAGRMNYLTGTTGVNHGMPYSLNFTSGSGSLGVPASQAVVPAMAFGRVEANPAGGNQDEEYIELRNPGLSAVDMSGWRVEGGVRFAFAGGTVVPAGGSVFVVPDRWAFRRRAASPRGGERLQVTGPYEGHLNNAGETLRLVNGEGAEVVAVTLEPALSDVQRWLAIGEVHYNPPGPGDETEYVEFVNVSGVVPLELGGVRMTSGLTGVDGAGLPVTFGFAAGTVLVPGGRLLVVRNRAAFRLAWPLVAEGLIAGEFPAGTALDNGGEVLKVDDATGSTVVEFRYGDRAPWPLLADGEGYSLVHMNPVAGDVHHGDAGNWRSSAVVGGSPGASDALPVPVDPAGDEDGDGLSNLLEHVMGDGAMFTVVDAAAGRTLVWQVRPGGDAGQMVIESSGDLGVWQTEAGLTGYAEAMVGGLIRRSAVIPASGERRYFRARVVPVP